MSLTFIPSVPDDLDFETSALIAKLALEDLDEVLNARKGKSREGSLPSDEEYAHELQREHYRQLLVITEDAKVAKSIADAVATDGAYVEALMTAELAAADDHRAAQMLSRGDRLPPPNATQTRLEDRAFVMHPDPPKYVPLLPKLVECDWTLMTVPIRAATANSDDGDSFNTKTAVGDPNPRLGTSSSTVISRIKPSVKPSPSPGPSANQNRMCVFSLCSFMFVTSEIYYSVHCTICYDEVRYINAFHTQCDHHYCRDCVKDLVENFTRDESLYPLRCCQQPLPIDEVIPFISAALRSLFREKHAEFSVLSKDRVYCVNPFCSKFLGSSEGSNDWSVVCPQCTTLTCLRCKQAFHEGEDCTVNAATIELRAIARREGWQTCPGCHTLIELNLGCYHMTCRCRTQFCYLCAERWKNCTCPQWDEARLIATAQQRVENELGPQAVLNVAPAVIQRQVQERAQALRYDHHCDPHSWTRRNGGGTCEECHWYLPDYLLVCVLVTFLHAPNQLSILTFLRKDL